MSTCGSCGAGNREGAQFCASCGAPTAAGCPSCGATPASPDSRFCDRCGAALAAAGPSAQARKVVTVLFADLVGSTATQEGMDPESVRRWLDRYYAAVRGEIESRGGRVVKFIGDGVMAVFGVPDVREDDAERAVAAARAMQGAVAELGGPDGEPGVGLRVGVNTGEVVVTASDDDVVGDVVNVAARLEQAARPGEVLVGEATFRLVRTRAQLRAVAPLELKGKSEPVPAFLLQSLHRTPEDAAASPFVGRAGELERLTAVLEAAIGDRSPQLASIVGAPGVGKSRLVGELGLAASAQARVVVVRCDPAGGATFAPVAAALRTAASLDDDASDETVLAGLTALFDEDEPDRHRIAERAAAVLGVGEPGLPEETFWAVRRLVENAARRSPMLFVFEDVHWAEPLLLDLVENLAAFTRDIPLLIVLTARPELREQRPGLVEVGGRVTAAIHLEGLAVDESRRLTRALLDGAALPTALLDRVAAASEGNPLFVRELVRMLVDDGVLRQDGGSWTAAVDARSVEVPLSIHAVLAARIDRLPRGEQAVLGAASILGRTFARGAVLHLVDPDVGAHLDEHLEGLRRKELVERAGTYWLDEPQLRFHHALVQDAAYRRLLKEVRADLHERAAAWLGRKVGDLAEHDDLIGYQLEQAHRLRAEAGSEVGELGRAAADRLRTAGRRSLEADDRPGAAALLGRALACLSTNDTTRPELLIERCEALLAMGDVGEAAPVVGELAAVAVGDVRLESWAACFVGELANLRDPRHLADTVGRAAEAATALDALGDHAGAAKAHAVRAASLARLGRIAECERALDQALGAARAAGDRRRATAILAGAPSAALWGPNPVTRASGRCLDVVRVLRITSRAPAVEAISLRCQAVLEALRGRDEAARRMLATARGSLEELGHALGLIELDLATGMVATLAGDLDDASTHLERAMEGFHELGIDVDAGLAAALLARVRIAQGAPAEALALTVESERLGGDDLKTSIAWRSVRAAALADEGDLDGARRLAEEAVALAEPTDALVDRADALVALAEVLAHAGDEVAAASAARRAVDLYERKEATVPAANARWLLGAEAGGAHGGPNPAPSPAGAAPLGPTRTTIASALSQRVVAAMTPFDRPAMAALGAPDLVTMDFRPLVGSDGPIDMVESAQGAHDVGVREVRRRVLGLRGDHLVLINAEFRMPPTDEHPDGGGLDLLQLMQADDEGRLRTNLFWDPEQAPDAWAELDRRYLDQLEPAAAEVWSVASALLAGMLTHDWEAMAAAISPAVVAVDHRPAGWGTVDRERFIELYRSSATLAPDGWFGVTDVHALTGRGVVAEAVASGTTTDGGQFQTSITAVLEVAGGVVVRIAYFPADRVDLALADLGVGADGPVPLLDELAGHGGDEAGLGASMDVSEEHQLDDATAVLDGRALGSDPPERAAGNLATDLFETTVHRLASGDADALRRVARDDIRFTDHRPVVGGTSVVGIEATGAWSAALVDVGFDRLETEVLGVRGQRLGLVRTLRLADGASLEAVVLCEADEEGRGAAVDSYDLTQISEAMAELDERYADQLPPGARACWEAASRLQRALDGRDASALAASIAEDGALVDHRPASWGTLGREQWIGIYRDDWRPSSDVHWHVRRVHDITAAGGWCDLEMHGTRDGGPFRTPVLLAFTIRADKVWRVHLWSPEDRAAAEAWFKEQSAGGVPLFAPDGELAEASGIPHNSATRLFVDAWARVERGDPDAVRWAAADDISFDDHRPLIGGTGGEGIDATARWSEALVDLGFNSSRSEVEAVRGDRLGILRVVRISPTAEIETLILCETDEHGRGRRVDTYDPSQIDEAMAELDARFADGLPPEERDVWRAAARLAAAMGSRDLQGLRDAIGPDGGLVDHRPLSWGSLGAEAWAEIFPSAWAESPDVRYDITQVESMCPSGAVVHMVLHGTRDGGPFETPIRIVAEVTPAGGVLCHAFAPEDSMAAGARFAEVSARSPGSGSDSNAAVRVVTRTMGLLLAGRVEEAAEGYAPDMVMHDHRPLVGGLRLEGREEFAPTASAIVGWEFDRWRHTVLAVHGDHLALVQAVFGDASTEVEAILLAEADDRERYRRLDVFDPDQLELARAALAARAEASAHGIETAVGRTWRRFRDAVLARDRAAAIACLAPDAEMRDHRPLVGMTVRGSELGPALDAFLELEVERVEWHPIARRGDALELGRIVMAGRDIISESLMIPGVDAPGRIDSYDVYEVDQLDEAFRTLDERFLAGEAEDSEAWRVHVESFAAMNTRDLAALEAQVREDFTVVDHRPLGWGTLGRTEYLALYPTMFEQSPDVRWRIVSDRLVTGPVVSTEVEVTGRSGGSGGFDIRFVSVLRTADDRGALLEVFPLEEEGAALARARELIADLGS